jgi:FkbM family methyltransferase
LNKAKEKIETFDIAVGRSKGSSLLYSPIEGAVIETPASLDKNFKENSTGIVVNVDTLDNVLFDEINVGLEVIIKIDVENCEHMVLEGMFKILDKHSPTIILEILENSKNKEIIYKILESNNLVELKIDGFDTSGDKKYYKNNNKLFVHAEKIEMFKRILAFK